MEAIDLTWVNAHVHARNLNGHKKSFGHVLVIAGSEGKAGAAILCARAALHNGCGMVTAMVPKEAVDILLSESPELMYVTDKKIQELDLSVFDAIAIGPGLGVNDATHEILNYLMLKYPGPMVIDADALTLIAKYHIPFKANQVITPHPGEFARLQGFEYNENIREKQAQDFVKNHVVNLVLKGAKTIVLAPSESLMINTTGNDGMATAGTGDVLTGMIAALCAQGYTSFNAACIGVYLHGLAGDIALQHKSKASIVASDLINSLSEIRLID